MKKNLLEDRMHLPREKLFFALLRKFLLSFVSVFGVILAIAVLFIGLGLFSDSIKRPEKAELVVCPDANGKRELLSSNTPVILLLKFHGVIGADSLTAETIESNLLSAQETLLGKRIKGIFLHLNTPGGETFNSESIYRTLKAFKAKHQIPIYAYAEQLCASGGMFIAAAADQIYTAPYTLVGSIGVILGPTFNFSGIMDKLGIASLTLSQGKDKDALNPFRPWVEGEANSLAAITKSKYDYFVNTMIASRPRLDKEKLLNEYGAQVFISSLGQEYGFVDFGSSNYAEALTALVKAAQIHEDESYQVFEIRSTESFLSDIVQAKPFLLKGKVVHSLDLGSQIKPELAGKFLYLYPGALTL